MLEINYKEQLPIKLSKLIFKVYPEISFTYFNILLKNRDIKINDVKINSDILLNYNDNIKIYANDDKLYKFREEAVYEDDNILIVNKPRGIESNNADKSYEYLIRQSRKDKELYVAHRLDTNTEGLLIIAKGNDNFEILKKAFKEKRIDKKYFAVVEGKIYAEKTHTAFLFKNAETHTVTISADRKNNYSEIKTKISPLERRGETTLLEITLITGKTHQIRAHLAYLGYPIIGDSKYGKNSVNKKYSKKKQMLSACKLSFNFDENSKLYYLNQKEIKILPDFIKDKSFK